jgi:hypothetical protein
MDFAGEDVKEKQNRKNLLKNKSNLWIGFTEEENN